MTLFMFATGIENSHPTIDQGRTRVDEMESCRHYARWQEDFALVQELGRERVFSDYRIRIAQVIHEARSGKPVWQPERRTPYNDPARRQQDCARTESCRDRAGLRPCCGRRRTSAPMRRRAPEPAVF